MAIGNTTIYGNQLDGDMNDIFFDEYTPYKSDYSEIAIVETAPPGNHYKTSEISGFGAMQEKTEGDAIVFDSPVEGHSKTVYYIEYAKGWAVTQPMFEDDMFGNIRAMPKKLGKSAAIKPDTVFFNLFNNGFASETSWDSQYVFDTDHTQLYTGLTNLANEPSTAGSLSETTLQAGYEYFWGVNDEAGLPITLDPDILLLPKELTWMAAKLEKTGLVIAAANNDINTVNPSNGVVNWRPFVSRHLTSSTAWFLLSKQRDCRLYWKNPASLTSGDDIYTGNALFKVHMRFGAFVFDYKGMYGNPGA